jgi:septal ring factor EnvC (AmiA/AmiB activator)
MWPKMLFELLPHFARLMPMADKYLSTRSASEKAQEAALAALAIDLRAEVGKSSDSQAGLLRQMQEQTVQIGELALDVTRARMGVEGLESRLNRLEGAVVALEAKSTAMRRLLLVLLALLVLTLGFLIVLVLRATH